MINFTVKFTIKYTRMLRMHEQSVAGLLFFLQRPVEEAISHGVFSSRTLDRAKFAFAPWFFSDFDS